MRSLFLVVREGENPDEADDVLVLDDVEILRAVGSLIARRLGVGSIPRPLRSIADRPLSLPTRGEQGGGGRPTATTTAREEVVLSE
jgi:hypothetical protein